MSSQTLSADADDRDVVQSSRASKRRRIGSRRPAQSIDMADGQESSDEEAAKVSRRRRTQASSAVADREGSEESSDESDPDDYSSESDSDGLNILGKAEVPLFGGYDAVDEGVLAIRAQHPDPGSIRAISMLDFMCHQNVTAYLGPNVNVITGKNGSGKSAICAALMLAFDCRPADTGRGASLAKMIRSGCSHCEVSVTFFNKEHEKRHFIGREREPAARIAPVFPATHTYPIDGSITQPPHAFSRRPTSTPIQKQHLRRLHSRHQTHPAAGSGCWRWGNSPLQARGRHAAIGCSRSQGRGGQQACEPRHQRHEVGADPFHDHLLGQGGEGGARCHSKAFRRGSHQSAAGADPGRGEEDGIGLA